MLIFSSRILPGLMMAMLLSGCSLLETRQDEAMTMSWQARQQQLVEQVQWQLNGRVAVESEQDAWSASLNWQQQHQSYHLQLHGPLGSGRVTLQGGPGYAVLRDSDGNRFVETSANRLLATQTGWQIPVEGLAYWVLALPNPQTESQSEFDARGRLRQLTQSGWQIDYQRYRFVNGLEMPEKIQLKHPAIKVKLVIKHWDLSRDAA